MANETNKPCSSEAHELYPYLDTQVESLMDFSKLIVVSLDFFALINTLLRISFWKDISIVKMSQIEYKFTS